VTIFPCSSEQELGRSEQSTSNTQAQCHRQNDEQLTSAGHTDCSDQSYHTAIPSTVSGLSDLEKTISVINILHNIYTANFIIQYYYTSTSLS